MRDSLGYDYSPLPSFMTCKINGGMSSETDFQALSIQDTSKISRRISSTHKGSFLVHIKGNQNHEQLLPITSTQGKIKSHPVLGTAAHRLQA